MLNFGILWINARNLLYIKKFNPKKGIRLANNKLETKIFLSERWIPVPETYWFIKNRKQLADFNFSYLPKNQFVIKPNEWSKGRWVLVTEFFNNWKIENWNIEKWKEYNKNNFKILSKVFIKWKKVLDQIFNFWLKNDVENNFLYKINGKIINDYELKRYLLDILDWKYSMSYWPDSVLVEEILKPWEWFKTYCKYGLADIRIIVFNLVPVVAMIRVPTEKSWWKANLNAWWIGFGINVSNGRIISMTKDWKILKSDFPWEYEEFYNKKIPFWDDILFLSSKIQFFVNLWYLALDRVITPQWPKILEINARAWLEVQNVTSTKLLRILDKISDLKVLDPEKWVEIAKTLFTQEKTNLIQNSKILYLGQYWSLKLFDWNYEIKYPVVAEVKLNKNDNYISNELYEEIKKLWNKKIDLELKDQEFIIKNISFLISKKLPKDKIIIWKDLASEFFIKPIDKTIHIADVINPSKILDTEREKLHIIDTKIHKIWNKLILNNVLRPVNYFDELDNFITWNWKYNPKFKYNWPLNEKFDFLKEDLLRIKDELNSNKIQSQIKILFSEKIEELFLRLNLIKSYKKKDYKDAFFYNEKLFWKVDKKLYDISKEKILNHDKQDNESLWRKLDSKETKLLIRKYLSDKNINWVDVFLSSTNFSRISVLMWKTAKIYISKNFVFKEKQLLSLLAHEVDVHLTRYLNWLSSWWFIFKNWTWFYLQDEEWLAIYNAEKIWPEDFEKISMYKKYYLIKEAKNLDFIWLADLIRSIYKNRSHEWVFKTAIKLKKWVINTYMKDDWALYMKEKVYLDWYTKIKNFIEKWWDVTKMYNGKIKIEDLDFVL